jgi:hypothetical protein
MSSADPRGATDDTAARAESGPALPGGYAAGILLMALTLAAMSLAALVNNLNERAALDQAYANLAQPFEQATKVRGQAESVAKQLARLAEQGNSNAREIVEALRRQGVTINPN